MGTQKGLSGIAKLFRTYGNYGDPEGLLGNCRIINDLRELWGPRRASRELRNYSGLTEIMGLTVACWELWYTTGTYGI